MWMKWIMKMHSRKCSRQMRIKILWTHRYGINSLSAKFIKFPMKFLWLFSILNIILIKFSFISFTIHSFIRSLIPSLLFHVKIEWNAWTALSKLFSICFGTSDKSFNHKGKKFAVRLLEADPRRKAIYSSALNFQVSEDSVRRSLFQIETSNVVTRSFINVLYAMEFIVVKICFILILSFSH